MTSLNSVAYYFLFMINMAIADYVKSILHTADCVADINLIEALNWSIPENSIY